MKPFVDAYDLSVGYEDKIVLSELSFKLFPGDFVCLMGGNGCGKSTILKTISSLLPPVNGSIYINGRALKAFSAQELSKTISVVLTDRLELPNMIVRDFIALGRVPYTNFWGSLTLKDYKIINEVINYLHLESIASLSFNKLSDGQKQKALIARALVQDTPILLLDEPTNFLDMPRKIELMVILKKIAKEKNKIVIFSSHDWELALEMNTHIWLLDDSGKLNVGMPEELILGNKIFSSFRSSEVKFSVNKGHFEEVIDVLYTVALTGEYDLIKWTAHALRKNGIFQDDTSSTRISCLNQKWIISTNDKKIEINNLFELISYDFSSL